MDGDLAVGWKAEGLSGFQFLMSTLSHSRTMQPEVNVSAAHAIRDQELSTEQGKESTELVGHVSKRVLPWKLKKETHISKSIYFFLG